jgi:hypothetical protein
VASFALPANCSPQFGGFRGDVEPAPDINEARARSTVPVRFTLTENRGLGERGVVAVSQQVDCATLAPVPGAPIEEVGARVSANRDNYSFDWRTDRAWAGTCRQLILRIQDVTDPVAVFRFR